MVDLAKFALAAFLPRPSTELDSPVPERTPRPEPEPEPEPEWSPPEAVASGGLASGGLAQTHRRAQTQRRPNSAEAGPEPEPEPDRGGFEDARNRTDSRREDAMSRTKTKRRRREQKGWSCCAAPTGDGN